MDSSFPTCHEKQEKQENSHSTSPSLETIRKTLKEMEDNIILGLIQRSLLKRNQEGKLYETFLTNLFKSVEQVHAVHGRYESPEEHPFYGETKRVVPCFQKLRYCYSSHDVLTSNHEEVNCNSEILTYYLESVLPSIAEEGVDEHRGTAALIDIQLLQEMSRRIHLGKMVAEAKRPKLWEEHPDFATHSHQQRLDWITYPKKEEEILQRIEDKTRQYLTIREHNLDPKKIVAVFRDFIIPITKSVQLSYLALPEKRVPNLEAAAIQEPIVLTG